MSAAPPRVALTPAGSSRRCHSRGRLHLRAAGIGPAQPPTGHPHQGRGRKITRPGSVWAACPVGQPGPLFSLACGREMAGVGVWFQLSVSVACG
jgi:hypothetical protein